MLFCDQNDFTNLDLSKNTKLTNIRLGNMPGLTSVCVWVLPFPPANVGLDTVGSPNITFTKICAGQTVRFAVDMSGQIVSQTGVHLAGNFQAWDPTSTLMTYLEDNTYVCSVTIPAGELIEYKFINGTTWPRAENVPSACATGPDNNRFLTVPPADTILPAVRFGTCWMSSINDPAEETGNLLMIYPNPAYSYVYIETPKFKNADCSLLTSYGQVVKNISLSSSKVALNIEGLKPGIYFLRVSTQDAVIVRKFIKE
jgi:hypothetical protein